MAIMKRIVLMGAKLFSSEALMKYLLPLLFLTLIFAHAPQTQAQSWDEKAQILQKEFSELRAIVATLTPDYVVGGLYNAKEYDDVTLLWKIDTEGDGTGENEVIRFYGERNPPLKDFGVTYYKSYVIVPGQVVLRRFYGPDSTGWRNDTIDYVSSEYIGSQGSRAPFLSETDVAIMKNWNLTIFHD